MLSTEINIENFTILIRSKEDTKSDKSTTYSISYVFFSLSAILSNESLSTFAQ